jgi:hypothetical protein
MEQDKHPRGSFGFAQDRLFDSAPQRAVSRNNRLGASLRACDFFDLSCFLHIQPVVFTPRQIVILSGALHRLVE